MSNDKISYQRLPDELIAEVFRNETLSCRDLFHCSLVSSKFVETVNRCLYEQILVEMDDRSVNEWEGDEDLILSNYTVTSWKLLRTLVEQKHLAGYVREVQFDYTSRKKPGEAQSGLPATQPQVLHTFLLLGSNIRSVIFKHNWGLTFGLIRILKYHKGVIGLAVVFMSPEEEEYCAKHLPHLKRLQVEDLLYPPEGRNVEFKSLEKLNLFMGVKAVTDFPSFSTSCSTFRSLDISLQLALQLDYSQFPALHSLTLGDGYGFNDQMTTSDSRSKARKFWKTLCRSPSLRILGFKDDEFKPNFEKALFQESSDIRGLIKPIPTLRSIRFEEEVPVERAYTLLTGPLSTTLRSVVVPSALARPDADLASTNKLGAVAFWCQARGIELILADQPRVSWTLLCMLVLFLFILLRERLTH